MGLQKWKAQGYLRLDTRMRDLWSFHLAGRLVAKFAGRLDSDGTPPTAGRHSYIKTARIAIVNHLHERRTSSEYCQKARMEIPAYTLYEVGSLIGQLLNVIMGQSQHFLGGMDLWDMSSDLSNQSFSASVRC
jgi:hypothetical protein